MVDAVGARPRERPVVWAAGGGRPTVWTAGVGRPGLVRRALGVVLWRVVAFRRQFELSTGARAPAVAGGALRCFVPQLGRAPSGSPPGLGGDRVRARVCVFEHSSNSANSLGLPRYCYVAPVRYKAVT